MKYSFDARFELARRLSATFQRSASKLLDADQVVRCHSLFLYAAHTVDVSLRGLHPASYPRQSNHAPAACYHGQRAIVTPRPPARPRL